MSKLLSQDTNTLICRKKQSIESERYALILIAEENTGTSCANVTKSVEDHAFVRKSQVAPKNVQKLAFCIKKPVMQIQGVADFIEWLTGNTGAL